MVMATDVTVVGLVTVVLYTVDSAFVSVMVRVAKFTMVVVLTWPISLVHVVA